MEWLKNVLTTGGFTGDVDALIGNINKELPNHFIPKHKYNDVASAKKQLEDTIAERDTQLAALSASSAITEDLKKEIDQLQQANQQAELQYKESIKTMKIDAALETMLKDSKVKFPDLLLSKFDKSKIEVGEDGTVKGIEEQLTPLKETYKDLFEVSAPPAQFTPQFKGIKTPDVNPNGGGGNESLGLQFAKQANAKTTPIAPNGASTIIDPWSK